MKPGSYVSVLLKALDRFGAAAVYNQPDIYISSLCWVVLTVQGAIERPTVGTNSPLQQIAFAALQKLRLSRWQMRSLLYVGKGLEWLSPGHCADARLGDLETCAATRSLLGPEALA